MTRICARDCAFAPTGETEAIQDGSDGFGSESTAASGAPGLAPDEQAAANRATPASPQPTIERRTPDLLISNGTCSLTGAYQAVLHYSF